MIKKNLWLLFFIYEIMFPVLADDFFELRTRLSHISGFYAKFFQKITDSTSIVLQESYGELWIQNPYCFNYHVFFPEESFLISNGETLWFYDPCINQVIVSKLKDFFDNVFLMIFVDYAELYGHKYFIRKNGDSFFLTPKKDQYVMFKKIEINITNQGIVNNICFFDSEDCCISYQLSHHDISLFNIDKFIFSPPAEGKVDEQHY